MLMTINKIHNSWLEGSQVNPQAEFRLFCLPHAGGNSLIFRPWLTAGFDNMEICPIQLPGREKRAKEKPFDQFNLLIQALAGALPLDKPFALFGHSIGALLCFELAREFRRQNRRLPEYLFLSSYPAPQFGSSRPKKPTHLQSDAEFVEELQRLSGTPDAVLQDDSIMQILLPVLRADFTLGETYTYVQQEALACSIQAYGGEQDPKVSRELLLGWSEHTRNGFNLRMFPGGHFFLIDVEHQLLSEISEAMAFARQL
jgi:medium-chain acyl-[acyl-carrier-protein] hydrolase